MGIAGDIKNFSFFLKSKMANQCRILRYDLLYILKRSFWMLCSG